MERALVAVEAALAPFDARPHWGKLFLADAAVIAPLYERLPDFARLVERLDPRGAFRNDWLERRAPGPLAHAHRGTRVAAVEHAVEPGSGQPDAVAAARAGRSSPRP